MEGGWSVVMCFFLSQGMSDLRKDLIFAPREQESGNTE